MMSEKLSLFLMSVGLGVVIAVHLAMNARAGEVLGSPRTGNTIFWAVGAATGLLIFLGSGEWSALTKVVNVPAGLWFAGVMGASLVLGISYAMPRLGVGPTTVALLLGQLCAGVVMSHFGWLSHEAIPLSLMKLTGIGAMVAGVFMVVL